MTFAGLYLKYNSLHCNSSYTVKMLFLIDKKQPDIVPKTQLIKSLLNQH